MDYALILKSLLSLVFVMGLIGIASVLARKYGPERLLAKVKPGKERRLKIIETLPIDAKRRLVLVGRDSAEHLLLLGAGHDVLIEKNIKTLASGTGADE